MRLYAKCSHHSTGVIKSMETNKDTISIIVPVYNTEKYLSQCIYSIISQSYSKLEIVLIDDGSRDNSYVLCEEFSTIDKRIRVIHQKNGGAAAARNIGLKIATGKILAFVDSDDYLDPTAFEEMLAMMRRSDADIVECAFVNEFQDKSIITKPFAEEKEETEVEYLRRFTNSWTNALIWNKLFKRELFDNILFEEGHRIDDEFFTYQGVMNAKKIVYTPKAFYHYRMRASSVMRDPKAKEKMLFDRLEYSTIRREKVVSRFPELKQEFDYSYLDSLLYWSKDDAATSAIISKIQNLIKEYFRNNSPCRMGLRFRLQLLRLQILGISKHKKLAAEQIVDENVYYE